jgi:hypothetical protein
MKETTRSKRRSFSSARMARKQDAEAILMMEETPICVADPYDLILEESIYEVYRAMEPCRAAIAAAYLFFSKWDTYRYT